VIRARSIGALVLLLLAESSSAAACSQPERRTSGRTIEVPAGADLQAALDDARPGDTLSLAAGAIFVGPFTLPRKRGTGWIVVRSAAEPQLPPAGSRVDPAHARLMPALESEHGPVIKAEAGAHHYRLVGLEVRPSRGASLTDVVQLGGDSGQTKTDTPAHFAIDRCYVHGDKELGARRGVALNSSSTDIEGSHFADFKERGADSQAIAGWNGPGPFRIVNNYLEAAGENVMFGGADPSVKGLVPSDIEIRGNHFAKPLAWKNATGQGKWSVKNLFELKNARRVLVEGNLFEHNWVAAQNGFAILMTVRNQDGKAPWSVVEDVTFTRNVVRHAASGISILGRDDNFPSKPTRRIRIEHNLFEDIGGAKWGGGGVLLQLVGGASDVVFDHNTAFHTDNVIMAEGPPHARFVFSNNIVQQNQYGIVGTGTGSGLPTLSKYFPGATVKGNVIVGGEAAAYPPHNFFPATLQEVGFTQRARGWPRLSGSSRYRGAATDKSDVGARVEVLKPPPEASNAAAQQPRADAR
jgi:hypothetical protein